MKNDPKERSRGIEEGAEALWSDNLEGVRAGGLPAPVEGLASGSHPQHREGVKIFITHIIRLSRESRMILKQIQNDS